MKDSNIKKLVIELAKSQVQMYEMISAMKDAHGSVADPFLHQHLHQQFDVSPVESAMILDHLKLVASEFDKLSDHVAELKALLAALE